MAVSPGASSPTPSLAAARESGGTAISPAPGAGPAACSSSSGGRTREEMECGGTVSRSAPKPASTSRSEKVSGSSPRFIATTLTPPPGVAKASEANSGSLAMYGPAHSSRSPSPLPPAVASERMGKERGKPPASPKLSEKVCEGSPPAMQGSACATVYLLPASRPIAAPLVVTLVRHLSAEFETRREHAGVPRPPAGQEGASRRFHFWLGEWAHE
mmetsp:Transcript_15111/g.48593  ORF Transcript_15111/g.48593 Transcript_15111/m.48593 type:complete len:215 (-) Transcript_15111:1585-2229(-)